MSSLSEEELYTKIEAVALAALAPAGVELVELKIGGRKNDVSIQVIADKFMGGITIEECAQLNRAIVEAIDNGGFLPQDGYILEFSSPGLDRPLVNSKDFARNLNREMRLWFKDPVEGKKEWSGILMGITNGQLTVFTKSKTKVILPLGQIIKGMLII